VLSVSVLSRDKQLILLQFAHYSDNRSMSECEKFKLCLLNGLLSGGWGGGMDTKKPPKPHQIHLPTLCSVQTLFSKQYIALKLRERGRFNLYTNGEQSRAIKAHVR